MPYNHSLPGPGDFCVCGHLVCRCAPEPDPEDLFEEAYQRGYDACEADGYGNHPLYWPSVSTGAEDALARNWRRLCMGGTITDTKGRKVYSSNVFNARPRPWPWPFRYNPLLGEQDAESFLMGWDDAGAGLPSAVRDPEAHAVHAAAMDACEPWALYRQPDLSDTPLGPWPAPSGLALSDAYDLPF